MSYFSKFPTVNGYDIIGRTFQMMDITRRNGFLETVRNNEAYYIIHEIQDGESPIVLADRMYDDSNLYWIIMLFNNIYDIDADWPLNQVSLNMYVERKYDDPYGVHHYESISNDMVVNSDWSSYDKRTVSNIDYEIELNDKKRKIKVPTPEAISVLVREHNRLIQQ